MVQSRQKQPCGVEGGGGDSLGPAFSQPLPQEVAFVPEHPASLLGLWIRRWADPGCADLPDPGAPTSAEVISTASFFSAQRAQPGSTLSAMLVCVVGPTDT